MDYTKAIELSTNLQCCTSTLQSSSCLCCMVTHMISLLLSCPVAKIEMHFPWELKKARSVPAVWWCCEHQLSHTSAWYRTGCLLRTCAPLVFIHPVTPSILPSISVDSRPLLRVYYSQPPTILSSPAISLLSLCGSYTEFQERSKSFTELQSTWERHRPRERERNRHTRQYHYRQILCPAVYLWLEFYPAQTKDPQQ